MDSRIENNKFYFVTPKFKPVQVPFTPDFQNGAKIEPNEG